MAAVATPVDPIRRGSLDAGAQNTSALLLQAEPPPPADRCLDSQPENVLLRWWRGRHRLYGPVTMYLAVCWGSVALAFYFQAFAASTDSGDPSYYTCYSSMWNAKMCGLDGLDCLPFHGDWFPVRCLPQFMCGASYPKNMVLFGTGPYRGDSFICSAAQHAGVVGLEGGCALVRLSGPSDGFGESCNNGLCSKAFPSWFPRTIEIKAPTAAQYCHSPTWVVNVLLAWTQVTYVLLFRPSKPALLVHSMLVGYWMAAVGLEPTNEPMQALVACSQRLPIMLAAALVIYHGCADVALFDPATRNWDNFRYFAAPMLVGSAVNSLLSRGIGASLNLQLFTEAKPWWQWLVMVLLTILVLVLIAYHARLLWQAPKDLKRALAAGYGVLTIMIIALCVAVRSGFSIHLHHNMFGLLLLPLTRFRNRPLTTICMGLLLGIFVNGMGAYGWSNMFDGNPSLTERLPKPDAPVSIANMTDALTIGWDPSSAADGAIGWVVYMNNVQVYKEYFYSPPNTTSSSSSFANSSLQPVEQGPPAVDPTSNSTTFTRVGLAANTTFFFKLANLFSYGREGRQGEELEVDTL